MTNQPLEKRVELNTDGLATESPHFDESAIAAAQPVEPLRAVSSYRRLKFPLWRPSWAIVALVVLPTIVVLVYLTVLSQRDALANIPDAPLQSEASAGQSAAPASIPSRKPVFDVFSHQKSVSRRTKASLARTPPIEDPSRPVARKVGEIFYGRPQR